MTANNVGSADIEVQLTQKVKDSLDAALRRTGKDEFAKIAGVTRSALDSMLEGEYVPMTLVSLACQLNKSYGDTDIKRTSVSECIKGALLRVPELATEKTPESRMATRRSGPRTAGEQQRQGRGRSGPFMDSSSGRLLGFGVNLITFLILGYFLGGFVLNPILGLGPSCEGLAPCFGSAIGLFVSAIGSLAYTYYYFVKKI